MFARSFLPGLIPAYHDVVQKGILDSASNTARWAIVFFMDAGPLPVAKTINTNHRTIDKLLHFQ